MKRIFLLLSTLLFAIAGYGQSNGTFNKVRAKQLQAYPTPGELIIIHDGDQDSEIFINSNAADSSLLTWMYHRLDSADLDAGEIDGVVIGANEAAAGSFTTIDADGGTIDGTVIGGTSAAAGSFTTADIDGGTIDGTVIGGSTPAAADFTNVTGTDFNGVALTDGGLTTRYLNEAGGYAIVNGAVTFGAENQIPSVNSSLDDYDYKVGLTHEEEPYNLFAAVFVHSLDVSSQDTDPVGASINNDGTELFLSGATNDAVYRYTLSTPYDLTTASYIHSLDISSQDDTPREVSINVDGTEIFMVGSENDAIYRYTLSTPYDLTTASYIHSLDVSSESDIPRGVSINVDGTEIFMVDFFDGAIYRYTLSTPYDLTTGTFTHSLDVSSQDIYCLGVSINNDGTELFMMGTENDNIYRYTLSTPYDLTTASYIHSLDISSQDDTPRGVSINVDGTEIFMVGSENDAIYRYNMTRLHTNSLSVTGGSIAAPTALIFSTSDTQAITIDDSQDTQFNGKITQSSLFDRAADYTAALFNVSSSGHGLYIKAGGTSGTRYIIDANDALGNQRLLLDDLGSLRLLTYSGTGTQDAQFTSNGTFFRNTSDEKTKKIYGKLSHGLDYVVSVAQSTIEYDYKDPDLNAPGYHYWGFGARAAIDQYGAQPAFRDHEGIYYWDSKQMIAPAYNAIAELHETNKIMTSWIVGLLIFIFMQTFAMILVGRHYLTKIRNNE